MKRHGGIQGSEFINLSGILYATTRVFFPILIVITLFTSCYYGKSAGRPALSVPEWVNNPPINERYYYAVGRSGPLIPVNDAWEQAKERGRAEIGRYIVSHIKSSFTSIQSTGGDYEDEIVETLSDTKLNYTEVVSQWHDVDGINGNKNHFYVLIRIERSKADELIRRFGR